MARKLNAQAIATITKRMRAIPDELKRAAEDELLKSAEKMAKDMRRDVPIDTHDLLESIKVRTVKDEADQVLVRVSAGDASAFYAHMVEFGAIMENGKLRQAQPFFFPNYRRHKQRIRAALLRALRRTAAKLEPMA